MKSLEKLREYVDRVNLGGISSAELHSWGMEIADEIEREIAERYMELPTDADDVPIRVGDTVTLKRGESFIVGGVRDAGNQWHVFDYSLQHWWSPLDLHHVKPRTLEDVLTDRINDVLCVMTSGIPIALETALNDSFGEECADEIRELLGGDGR